MNEKTKHLFEKQEKAYAEDFQTKFSENFGIVCFSGRCDNVLMWGLYAECHQGFVVEFEHTLAAFPPLDLMKVSYSSERPSVEEQGAKVPLTKNKDWSHEEEYRFIMPLERLKVGQRRDKRELHFLPLSIDSVKAVYFGCRITGAAKKELVGSLRTFNPTKIRRYSMEKHPREYKMVPIPCHR